MSSAAELVVIADDLTGSCDTGVQFAARGISTLVTIAREHLGEAAASASVLVVDTESRHVAPEEAAARVKAAALSGRRAGVQRFYKKADSTLRGNVGAEIEALMRAIGVTRLAFIPGFPATGRTTRNGELLVNGVPLAQSAFARDPHEPARDSSVCAILSRGTDLPVIVISPRDACAGRTFGASTGGIAVFDCEDDDDLERIANILSREDALLVTAGAGGFASVLADKLGLTRSIRSHGTRYSGAVLAVCGSLHPASLRQADYATRHGFVEIALPWPPPQGSEIPGSTAERIIGKVEIAAARGANVLLRARAEPGQDVRAYALSARTAGADSGVAAALARLAERCLTRAPFAGAVVFGGDTALQLMLATNSGTLRPRLEIAPGVVLSDCESIGRDFAIVTKAGGFGDEDVLVKISDFFA